MTCKRPGNPTRLGHSSASRSPRHLLARSWRESGLSEPGAPLLQPLSIRVSANPSFIPEFVVGHAHDVPPLLPLASAGILRWVWQSRYGAILIEVMGDDVFVNGHRVEPHAP